MAPVKSQTVVFVVALIFISLILTSVYSPSSYVMRKSGSKTQPSAKAKMAFSPRKTHHGSHPTVYSVAAGREFQDAKHEVPTGPNPISNP
nr:CLAVATA3/ESR (CLE)-related protein TDIF-like [Ipomoea batatas]GMD87306.1 CLAVATA3/ESR (CLE)-related protein TDIF-like [Ipomoea batatas]GME20853.1 CLAVATA3/ESR (CLE)-related protein TDIF-like [Ipomoea batatas]